MRWTINFIIFLLTIFANQISSVELRKYLSKTQNLHINLKKELTNLFSDKNGFTAPESDCKIVDNAGGSSVYGELDYDSWQIILKDLNSINALKGVFYDLGSGIGKLTIHTILKFPNKFKKIVGVELCKNRYNQAIQVKEELVKRKLINSDQLEFRLEDIAKTYIDDAKIIYMCSTLYPRELMQKLYKRFKTLKQGTIIISLKPLPDNYPSDGIICVKKYQLSTTWNKFPGENIYLYIVYTFNSEKITLGQLLSAFQGS